MKRLAWLVAAGLALTGSSTIGGAQATKEKGKKAEAPLDSAAKAAKKQEKNARKANQRALFADTDPIEFSLIANYGALARDRDTLSTKRFAGTVIVADSAGAERRIPVRLRTRGHFRLLARNCRFVPIRIDFPDSGRKNTPFAGQAGVKLGTHCQNGDERYDRYTRREYLAYRVFTHVSPYAFRARLATGTYVDSASGKTVATHTAMFIENEDDLARRAGGKIAELRGALFDDLESDQLLAMSLFLFAIGNTDFSLYALHNTRLLQMPQGGTIIPLTYDFDFSGLVGAHYATPDPRMGIRRVQDRRFRGPCRPIELYQKAAQRFLNKKAEILSEVDAVPGMNKDDQAETREYLLSFFAVLENPGRFKRDIVDACESKPGL